MGFFSILRFNMRKEQIARFSQPRNPRGTRSPSVSARSAQSAQAVQATRQRLVGSVSAVRAVRAENSALRTFRAIFFERQCAWRGGNAPQSIKNLFEEQPARGRRLKIIAPFFRCKNLFDVGF